MEKKKMRFNFSITFFVVLVILLVFSISTFFIFPNKVFALTASGINGAVKAGNGAELWNSSTNTFNVAVLGDLKQKLFGNENPLSYINDKHDTNEYKLTGSKIVTAKTLNEQVGKPDEGMVVRLGGQDWMITSLTTTNDDKEDIVLTLYLANPATNERVQYWKHTTNSDPNHPWGMKGENMYSRSILRQHLLTAAKWSMFSKGYFANNFLVQPTKIQYQHTQSTFGRGGAVAGYYYHNVNDALEPIIGDGKTTGAKWHNNLYVGGQIPYKPSDVFNDNSGKPQIYDAWGADYIWVPSMLEASVSNIWKISATQRKFWDGVSNSENDKVWLRSGDHADFNGATGIYANGNSTSNHVVLTWGVRPAVHLNLTAALANKLDNPKDLSSTYNEKEQTLSEIASADENATWYEKDIYENSENYIKITYENNEAFFKNADEYWVKFEITQEYIDAVNKQVEDEGTKKGWTDDEIAKMKGIREPKFLGTAEKSEDEHAESDTVRWIKITINQAEIDFSNVKWSADEFEYNGEDQTLKIISGLPDYVQVKYGDNAQKAVGTHTAVVEEIISTNPNYRAPTSEELSNYPTLSHTWEITKKKIPACWKSANVTQDGVTISVPVLNVDKRLKSSIEYTYYKDAELTQSINLADIIAEFDITDLKTYWVKATLKVDGEIFNSSNCMFVQNGQEVSHLVTKLVMIETPIIGGDVDTDKDSNIANGNGDGKLSLYVWILVGVVAFLIILLLVVLIAKNKKLVRVQTAGNTTSSNCQTNNNSRYGYVNDRSITDKDWTFIVREKDVLNIQALENQTERVLMYACKESDVRKLKHFQDELAENNQEQSQEQESDRKNNKKKKKK